MWNVFLLVYSVLTFDEEKNVNSTWCLNWNSITDKSLHSDLIIYFLIILFIYLSLHLVRKNQNWLGVSHGWIWRKDERSGMFCLRILHAVHKWRVSFLDLSTSEFPEALLLRELAGVAVTCFQRITNSMCPDSGKDQTRVAKRSVKPWFVLYFDNQVGAKDLKWRVCASECSVHARRWL